MTVREWFRVLRRHQPPSLELQEFLRTFGRIDSEQLALERKVLFRVALEEMGLVKPDPPQALTFHRLELGSLLMGRSLRYGYSRDYQPEPRFVLHDEPEWVWPPADHNYLRRIMRIEGVSGDPTARE